MTSRTATISRSTKETRIDLTLNLDGDRTIEVRTGIGMLDHLLTSLAFHAGWSLSLNCDGDLQVDDHHTAEDCALALGEAIAAALDDRTGVVRFGSAYAPLDEALARAVIDLSGRPFAAVQLGLTRDRIGELACENVSHVLRSLAITAKLTLHLDVLRGENDHHKAEAAFKSLALSLRAATAVAEGDVPSTKGSLGGTP
jgi:imidazoleglycerol phosphate dehydratase HisB